MRIKCIDPSKLAGDILNKTYSSILMSGTLSPISMYKDILGVANCRTLELDSPFAAKNQLTMVDDSVSSKYSERSDEMFNNIARNITDSLFVAEDKNAIVFFPSYDLMDKVVSKINLVNLNRKVLKEQRYMNKEDKEKFVDKFKSTGAFDDKSKSMVVDLSMTDEVPERCQDVINKVIDVYNFAAIEDKNALGKNTLEFIDERLFIITDELEGVERGVQAVKEKEGITVDPGSDLAFLYGEIGEYGQRLTDLEVEKQVLFLLMKHIL